MPKPKPILLRPGESIASAIGRSVRVLLDPQECTSEAGEGQVTERWVEVAVEPETVYVDVTGREEDDFRECWRQDGALVTAERVIVAQRGGRAVAEYFLEAEPER